MKVFSVGSSMGFGATVPVKYMARDAGGQFEKVEDPKEAEKCKNRVAKMLNSKPEDLKNDKAKNFVEFYKRWDGDYARKSVVTSHVPYNQIWHNYLITGQDAVKMNDYSDEIGKTMKIIKREANELPPKEADRYISDALNREKKRYCKRAEGIIQNKSKKLRDSEGDPLCLIVYFDKVYGKRSGKLNDFKFHNARIMKSSVVAEAEAERAKNKEQ